MPRLRLSLKPRKRDERIVKPVEIIFNKGFLTEDYIVSGSGVRLPVQVLPCILSADPAGNPRPLNIYILRKDELEELQKGEAQLHKKYRHVSKMLELCYEVVGETCAGPTGKEHPVMPSSLRCVALGEYVYVFYEPLHPLT